MANCSSGGEEKSDDEHQSYRSSTSLRNDSHVSDRKEAKSKYNNLQVRFDEIAENLDYTQMLFTDNRDYEEIKLRNKKLENDLIHSNERYLDELSMVRENFENQIKSKTSMLQSEIDELHMRKERIHLEHNRQINNLQDVIETERTLQKIRFQDIISHFDGILERTLRLNGQLKKDYDALKEITSSLKNQTHILEYDLKREFSDNLDILRRSLSSSVEANKTKYEDLMKDVQLNQHESDHAPRKLNFEGECDKKRNL